jgi:1,2-phenylacetyl-CoA epoxidase PaaB subunit
MPSTDPTYIATLFVMDETTRLFKHSHALHAADVDEAIALAKDWLSRNKPRWYEAVELLLRRDGNKVWSRPINDLEYLALSKP